MKFMPLLVLGMALPAFAQAPVSADRPLRRQASERFGPLYIMDPDDPKFLLATVEGRHRNSDGRKSAELEDISVTFSSRRQGDSTETSPQVRLESRLGILVNEEQRKTVDLRGGVRVTMEDGTELTTEECRLDIRQNRLRCPRPVLLVRFGPPVRFDPLSLWTGRPAMILSGDEMEIDFAEKSYTVHRNGYLWISGRVPRLSASRRPTAAPSSEQSTLLACEGPLTIRDLSEEIPGPHRILRISAHRAARLERVKNGERIAATAESMVFYVAQVRRERSGAPAYGSPSAGNAGRTRGTDDGESHVPLSLALRGGIRMSAGEDVAASAERLDWNREEDILRLTGSPLVEVTYGGQSLRAREVTVDQWTRVITFHDDISATVLIGGDKGALTLRPRRMELQCVVQEETWKAGVLNAWDGVSLTGFLGAAGDRPIRAEGTAFSWDLQTGLGSLSGAPYARVLQGDNLIEAPLLVFHGQSTMIIKGPKILQFVEIVPTAELLDASLGLGALRPFDSRQYFSITCEGDVVFTRQAIPWKWAPIRAVSDGALGLGAMRRLENAMDVRGPGIARQTRTVVKLVDRCRVRSHDSSLSADLLYVMLSGEASGVEQVVGYGNIRMQADRGPGGWPIHLWGDALVYNLVGRRVELHGLPAARWRIVRILKGRPLEIEMGARRMVYDERRRTIEGFTVDWTGLPIAP